MPDDLSPLAVDFLRRCFSVNPHSRPQASELLHHPFVADAEADEEDQEDDNEIIEVDSIGGVMGSRLGFGLQPQTSTLQQQMQAQMVSRSRRPSSSGAAGGSEAEPASGPEAATLNF